MEVRFAEEGTVNCDKCCLNDMCPKQEMCPCDSWLCVYEAPVEGQEVYFVESTTTN